MSALVVLIQLRESLTAAATGRRSRCLSLLESVLRRGEGIVSRRVRSLVRLNALDQCQFVARNATNHPSAFNLEQAHVVVDRESRAASSAVLRRRQLVDQVIERIPEVLDSVAHRESDVAGRFLPNDGIQDVLNRFARSSCFLGP